MINTVSGLLFPLITFPYASRVILAEGIGQVQFYSSIINYVILFTGIGIPLYGIREIARVRDDVRELGKTTAEILSLNLLLNIAGYVAIAILCLSVQEIQENLPLFLLLSTSVVLTSIGCPWFYSGVEDFRYVTLRGLFVKILCVILLFTLVKTKEDLLLYGAYTVLGYIGNNVLNFIHLRSYIRFSEVPWRRLDIWRHLKPAFAIFVLNVIISIYLNLDSVMLGFLNTTESVGFYTAATKLSHMLVTLVTSLGAVMLPRLTNLLENKQQEEFYRLARKSYRFILMLAFPVCWGVILLAPSLIRLFCGTEFEPAILTLQIISPVIIAIGISNLIGIQVLYPLGKVKLITLSTAIGAFLNFTLNLLLIPRLAQDGAAIATVTAEIGVTVAQFILAGKYIPFSFWDRKIFTYLAASVVMVAACSLFCMLDCIDVVNILCVPVVGAFLYGSILFFVKDELAMEIIGLICKRIKC